MTCRLSQIVGAPKELLEAFPFKVAISGIKDWRPKYNIAAGQHGSTDQVRSGRFSARLGLNWLLERLQQ